MNPILWPKCLNGFKGMCLGNANGLRAKITLIL